MMIGRVCRPLVTRSRLCLLPPHTRRTGQQQRQFSAKAVYTSFPATLLYYSPSQKSSLYDVQERDSRPDALHDEGVSVAKDGLVHAGIDKKSAVSNGAVMYPNTFFMQELIRQYCDETLDREDEGKQVETPFIYTIPKGTQIPSHLTLINEYISRFSLQPQRGMSLRDLNEALDVFYEKHASRETVDEWLDKHPFHSAMDDEMDKVWMSK